MHPLWDTLDDAEFRATIFLLSYVSQTSHKTGEAELSLPSLARMSGISAFVLTKTLVKLFDLGLAESLAPGEHCAFTVHAPGEHSDCTVQPEEVVINNETAAPGNHGECTVRAPGAHCATNERTNERTKEEEALQKKSVVVDSDLLREAPPPPNISETEESENTEPEEEIVFGDLVTAEFLGRVPLRIQKLWISTFGPDKIWVEAEIKKAATWWESNEHHRQAGDTIPRFVNKWLTKAKKEHNEFVQTASHQQPLPTKAKAKTETVPVYFVCSLCGKTHSEVECEG